MTGTLSALLAHTLWELHATQAGETASPQHQLESKPGSKGQAGSPPTQRPRDPESCAACPHGRPAR